MMKSQTIPWDSASHLETEADIAAYLKAVFLEKDPALAVHALKVIRISLSKVKKNPLSPPAGRGLGWGV
jgi:DNA-binding phage protein